MCETPSTLKEEGGFYSKLGGWSVVYIVILLMRCVCRGSVTGGVNGQQCPSGIGVAA